MISLYHPAQSIIHNIAAGYKVLLLLILGTTLFQVDRLEILVGAAVGVSLLYVLAKIPVKLAFQQLKPALFLLAIIFLAQIFILGLEAAIFVVLRFLTLILAANLVTLTTLMSHMIGAIEKGLSVFGRWLPVAKVSLALSLTLRFIPVIGVMADEVREAYLKDTCDVYTTDQSGLYAQRSVIPDPENHIVLPEIISKEPLGPLVRHGDNNWGDVARWTLNVLIIAEELGVTQANLEEMKSSKNPAVARLLGVSGDLGSQLGLKAEWAANAIGSVGNYGEVFERHIGMSTNLKIERGLNQLWNKGGILYAPPAR